LLVDADRMTAILARLKRCGLCGETGALKLAALPGLEIRCGGFLADGTTVKQLQSVCPPSVGADGLRREWNDDAEIAEAPEAFYATLEAIAAAAEAEYRPAAAERTTATSKAPTGTTSRYTAKILANASSKVATAPEGSRHDTLLAQAKLCGGYIETGALTKTEVTAELTRAAKLAGLPDQEVEKTIGDGISYGEAEPLSLPEALARPSRNGPAADAGTTAAEPDEWLPIRLGSLPPADPFPLDVLPQAARALAEAAARSISCPVDFPAVATIAVASGIIGRAASLRIKPGYFASASLYVGLVGGQSSGKSPALRAALAPLWRIAETLDTEWRKKTAAWENSEPPDPAKKPILRRVASTDPTTEALGPLLAKNPRGLTVATDEMTKWVLSMDQYKGGKGGDRPFYLSAWNGEPVYIDRAKHMQEPIAVPHPFISVVGGIIPDMLSTLAEGKGREDGFTGRLLFAFPERIPRCYSDEGIAEAVAENWDKLVQALWNVEPIDDEGKLIPRVVRLTTDASCEWSAWCQAHYVEQEQDGFPDSLAGPWGKLEAYVGRLALILHLMHLAADPTTPPPNELPALPVEIITDAARLVAYFKAHARRVYAAMARKSLAGGDDVKALIRWILRNDLERFSTRDIQRNFDRFQDDEAAVVDTLGWMMSHNLIRPHVENVAAGKPGRKRSPAYDVNPALRKSPRFRHFRRN
jgi:hypothetical protein